jgi:predicted RNase H-like HicB family nuclease
MKNKYIYPAIFITEKEGGYSVIFPDLRGCQTQGDTLEEALNMSKEALGLYIFDKLEDKKELPKASNPSEIEKEEGTFISLIEFDLIEFKKIYNKSVKKTLTIPSWLNMRAEEAHINFSKLLQKAIKQELNLEEL